MVEKIVWNSVISNELFLMGYGGHLDKGNLELNKTTSVHKIVTESILCKAQP